MVHDVMIEELVLDYLYELTLIEEEGERLSTEEEHKHYETLADFALVHIGVPFGITL